ncbi:MAG TPA: ribosome biogenesis GTPase Der [Bacillota bacterium]|nr:ribosome biogenesis GTPase Der [Bacillota bacterium]
MAKPLVAIVGRPNVGKSALFNRIIRSRSSIVDDSPGITRDRVYSTAEWSGRSFAIVDTGGIEADPADDISTQTREHAEHAMKAADVIIFVVDARSGITSDDKDVAQLLRIAGKPVILAANKVDHPAHMDYEFYALGLGDPMPVSAVHGIGIGNLLDAVVQALPPQTDEPAEKDDDPIRVALVGRPNVGKSSLANRILGEERSIVSDTPGTTRDALDTVFDYDGTKYVIIDTAGIRRRGKVDPGVEKYSVLRAFAAVDRCDVAVTVIDGTSDPVVQDTKIAGYAHEAGKAGVIAVNKWDMVDRDKAFARDYERKIRTMMSFMPYADVLFVSALTGRGITKLLDAVRKGAMHHRRRIQTSMVNRVVQDAVLRNPPPSDKGKAVRIFYASQVSSRPPLFVVWTNYPELIHFSYKRYLENAIREAFEFSGTPIIVQFRARD